MASTSVDLCKGPLGSLTQAIMLLQIVVFMFPLMDASAVHPHHLPEGSLREVNVGLGDVPAGYSIAAFGDFNNDQHTDIFVLSDTKTAVSIYVWKQSTKQFERYSTAFIEATAEIQNIVPSDYNYDGWLDVAISLKSGGELSHSLYVGNGKELRSLSGANIPSSSTQLLALDANGDMKVDLFGTVDGKRTYLINNGSGTFNATVQAAANGTSVPSLRSPASSAYTDVNGDCRADLLTVSAIPCDSSTSTSNDCTQVDIWLATLEGFELYSSFQAPAYADAVRQLSVVDVDGDSAVDVVFPLCSASDDCAGTSGLVVLFNAASHSGKRVRTTDVCEERAGVYYESAPVWQNVSASAGVVYVTKTNGMGGHLWYSASEQYPITARFGDFDLDGFPDFVAVTKDGATGSVSASLFLNQPCTVSTCGKAAVREKRRTFVRVDAGIDELENIDSPSVIVFFDLFDDGILDLLVLTEQGIVSLENTFLSDDYFLKCLGLNGVCGSWCTVDGHSYHPYGVNQPGITYQFRMSDWGGSSSRYYSASQLTQSAHLALQLPFVHFGLGDWNNYVEKFTFGTSAGVKDNHWSSLNIVPNTQLVAIPHPPRKAAEWGVDMYLSPSAHVSGVVLSMLTCIALLAGPIMYFRWKEKREDEQEKKEKAHVFSFAAL